VGIIMEDLIREDMSKKFTLYWSYLEMYENCPQRFLWTKGWKGVDFGFGVGEKMPKPKQDSMHHAIMGIVIAKAMEDFYNLEWWREASSLQKKLEGSIRSEFKYQLQRKYVDWEKSPTEEDLLQVCLEKLIIFDHVPSSIS